MGGSRDRIIIKQGDITDMEVEAIVNAANTELVLGSGVAGAIRKKGGDTIQEECDNIGRIPLGQAVITGAGKLKSKYIIHAAGMHLGGRVTEESLRECTMNCLLRADEKGIRTIAFPAIGTGVGGFPVAECARVMIDTVIDHIKRYQNIETVYFVLFDEKNFKVFDDCLKSKQGH
ncbi:MAG TPA: macro domain-containing protein [Thermodesulfobacteriota bacterium]|nr:macro domain-containing protein [Thermodesulfobacteriota bacterium]